MTTFAVNVCCPMLSRRNVAGDHLPLHTKYIQTWQLLDVCQCVVFSRREPQQMGSISRLGMDPLPEVRRLIISSVSQRCFAPTPIASLAGRPTISVLRFGYQTPAVDLDPPAVRADRPDSCGSLAANLMKP